MKKNESLIFRVLEWAEEYAGESSVRGEDFPNFLPENVIEHVRLCLEAGFVEAEPKFSRGRGIPQIVGWRIHRLTWEGQKALERIRNGESYA